MPRHDFDIVAFAGGLVTLAGALLYLLHLTGTVEFDGRWVAAAALILTGVSGVALAVSRVRRSE